MPEQRWEHFTFTATNLKLGGEWKAELAGQQYVGWDAILDAVSRRGWEVISTLVAGTSPASGGQFTSVVRVFLKRPVES